jgi:tetratricopeptide (TPR) repeat protein
MRVVARQVRSIGLFSLLVLLSTDTGAGQRAPTDVDRLMAEAEQLWLQGHPEQALRKLGEALARAREIDQREPEWKILDRMGRIHLERDQFQPALEHFQQGLTVALDLGDGAAQATELMAIGETYTLWQRHQDAINTYEALLALEEERQDRLGQWHAYYGLGFAHKANGAPEQALSYVERALAVARVLEDTSLERASLEELEADYASLGDYGQVARYSEELLQLGRNLRDRRLVADKLATSGYAHEQTGDLGRAITRYESALLAYRDLVDAHGEWRALDDLGRVTRKQGDNARALDYFREALQVAQRSGFREGQVLALEHTAAALRGAKEYSKALPPYQQALKIAREGKLRDYEWLMLSDLAQTYAQMGNAKAATSHYQQALKITQQMGNKEAEKQVRDQLQRLRKPTGSESKTTAKP